MWETYKVFCIACFCLLVSISAVSSVSGKMAQLSTRDQSTDVFSRLGMNFYTHTTYSFAKQRKAYYLQRYNIQIKGGKGTTQHVFTNGI